MIFGLGATAANAGTISLGDAQRGQFREAFTSNGNSFPATNFAGTNFMVVGSAFGRVHFLSYDLSTVTAPVTGAVLRLEVTDHFNANSGIPVELPVTLYDCTGGGDADLKLSQSGSAAQTMFDDLSSGNAYATQTFDELLIPGGSIVDIYLSAAAIADINAAGGLFTIGIAGDLIGQNDSFRTFTETSQSLVLTTDGPVSGTDVPEPAAVLILGMGFLGMAVLRRRIFARSASL